MKTQPPESKLTEKVFRWIRFELEDVKDKTCVWSVFTKDGGYLGSVKWWSGWRKYCFFPANGSLYEQDCLNDIAEFLETATGIHKAPPATGVEDLIAPF